MCSQAHSLTALVSVSISPDSLEPCEAKYSSCSLLYICYCAYREYKEVLGMCQVFFWVNWCLDRRVLEYRLLFHMLFHIVPVEDASMNNRIAMHLTRQAR